MISPAGNTWWRARERSARAAFVSLTLTLVAVTAAATDCTRGQGSAVAAEDSSLAVPDTSGKLLGDTIDPATDSVGSPIIAPPQPVASGAAASDSVPPKSDSQPMKAPAPPELSPLADTISQFLVFDPIVQTWFLASKRGKRLLIDIGRVDADVRRDKHRASAFREAAKALSPIPVGTPIRVYDALGVEDDTITGFDSWNGRIVATFRPSPGLDSLVLRSPAAYAAVERTDTVADSLRSDSARRADSARAATAGAGSSPAAATTGAVHEGVKVAAAGQTATPPKPAGDTVAAPVACRRDTLATALGARAAAVRDSLDLWLRTLPPPPFDRLVSTERTQASQVVGCFGGANRVAIAVDLRAGANEWIRERAVLLDTLGHVTTLRVYDYRFKGHDFVAALDPNGQGIDGVVARGVTEASGATVILALEPGNRLARWVAGFAWESR